MALSSQMDFTRDRRKTHHRRCRGRRVDGPRPSARLSTLLWSYWRSKLARNCLNWQQFRRRTSGGRAASCAVARPAMRRRDAGMIGRDRRRDGAVRCRAGRGLRARRLLVGSRPSAVAGCSAGRRRPTDAGARRSVACRERTPPRARRRSRPRLSGSRTTCRAAARDQPCSADAEQKQARGRRCAAARKSARGAAATPSTSLAAGMPDR